MRPNAMVLLSAAIVLAGALATSTAPRASETGAAWSVEKQSGDVSISSGGAQPASLSDRSTVKPGDTIRTGPNGMLLLRRGAETMLLSANAVVEIPASNRDGMSTTIFERAGSILLEVEKQKVNHFEVVTPYLAAVVKGTRFRVSADGSGSSVEVLNGQVQVSDFPSGDKVLLLPGQTAETRNTAKGLKLSGSGLFNPVEAGAPAASPVRQSPAKDRFAAAETSQPAASAATAPMQLFRRSAEPSSSDEQFGLQALLRKFDSPMLGVPVFVGLLVSVAISAQRRREKRKKQPPRA